MGTGIFINSFLNTNFCNVLNIDDFIENYKNKYCLTKEETQILLDNSSLGGLENCITTLACYLQRIAHKMYTDLKGQIEKSKGEVQVVSIKTDLNDKNEREYEKAPDAQQRSWLARNAVGDFVRIENGSIILKNPQTGKDQIILGRIS